MSLSSRIEALASRIAGEMQVIRGESGVYHATTLGSANILLNPMGQVAQGGAGPVDTSDYFVDQWRLMLGSVDVSAQQTPGFGGFISSLSVTVSSARDPLIDNDRLTFRQPVEANRVAVLGYGSGSAKGSTICFVARCDVPGSYTLSINSAAWDQTFIASFSLEQAGVPQFVSIPVPPPPSGGDWATAQPHLRGAVVSICAGAGPQWTTDVEGWQAASGGFFALSGTTNLAATPGATFSATGFVWAPGEEVLTEETLLLSMRPYAEELLDCQRYFWEGPADDNGGPFTWGGNTVTGFMGPGASFPVQMRTSPAMSVQDGEYTRSTNGGFAVTPNGFRQYLTCTNVGQVRHIHGVFTANARL